MGVDDRVPFQYSLAEIQERGTDRLNRTREQENFDSDTGRRHNEGVIRWNNIMRKLTSRRNAGRMILMDIEHELRAMDQARPTTDRIHFDSIEGQACIVTSRGEACNQVSRTVQHNLHWKEPKRQLVFEKSVSCEKKCPMRHYVSSNH